MKTVEEEFWHHMATQLAEADQCMAEGEINEAGRRIHSLVSCAALMGEQELSNECKVIEERIRRRYDVSSVRKHIQTCHNNNAIPVLSAAALA